MTFPDLTEIDLRLEDMSDCGEQGMTALAVALDIDRWTGYSCDPK